MNSEKLQQQIDERCPCFSKPLKDCDCQSESDLKARCCPLGWNCKEMGQNSSGFGCSNKGKCSAIAKTLSSRTHPNPEAVDALDFNNPYLAGSKYQGASYWYVRPKDRLPQGYMAAEKAKLPCLVENGVIEVVASDRGYMPAVHNPNFFLEIGGSPIVLIEWCEGSLRQIYTEVYKYWCNERKDGTLLCSSDADEPIEGEYWLDDYANPWQLSLHGDPKRIELTSDLLKKLKTWLDNVVTCEEQHYCIICQDAVYEDNYGSCECNHLHYIDWLSCWGGCGYAEEDLSENYRVALSKIAPSVQKVLKKHLEATNIHDLWALAHDLSGDELEPAVAWLKSLDNDTPDAIAQTLIWLEENN